jgi:myb proto-oncogene protein
MPAHGDKDWVAISAQVPGRTRDKCSSRWHDVLDPSIGRATAHAGRWTADEDKKLRDAVPALDDKDWVAISAQVPFRTRVQCKYIWYYKAQRRPADGTCWQMDS